MAVGVGGEQGAFIERVGPRKTSICVPLVLAMFLLCSCGSQEERAQSYYESGMALIAKNDDLGARIELLKAVKYNQNKVEVWRALAGIDERTGATSLPLDLRRIVELDPSDQVSRLRLATMMFNGGATETALRTVDSAPPGGKPNAGLAALRANILAKLNDANGAVREAQKAVAIDPANIDAALILASDKLAKSDADGAMKIFDSLPIAASGDVRIRIAKVQIYERKNDLQKAESELKELIKANPKQSAFRTQLVRLYIFQRRLDDAERELREISATNPADTKPGLDIVRFLNTVRGSPAARQELDARIKRGGDVFSYQLALAELDFAQGNIADSTKLLESLITTASSNDKKLEAQIKLAEVNIANKNISAAETIVANIIRTDRRNTRALALRASINIDQGQYDNALRDLREALNDQPKNPQLLLLMALAYERNGQAELADRQYTDALKTTNSDPSVGQQYVAFLRRRGNINRAEDVLVEVASRNPRNIDVLSSLAQVRLARQNFVGALELADRISALGNDGGVAEQIRGAAFAGQNKPDLSIAALERAQAAAPSSLQVIVPLVTAYLRSNKADKAEALLQSMLKNNPTSAELLVLMGQTQVVKNAPNEAIKSFRTAITQQPKNALAYGALSDLYIRRKNYDDAYNVIQAGLREQPDNFNFRLTLAGIIDTKGNHEAAITQYEALLKEQPRSIVVINNLVSLLMDYRSDKPSIERAMTLSENLRNSKIPQYLDTFGWAQYHRGDYKTAVILLEEAKSKLPDLAAVRYHLGMAYVADRQHAKASEELKAAFQLEPAGSELKEKIRVALVKAAPK